MGASTAYACLESATSPVNPEGASLQIAQPGHWGRWKWRLGGEGSLRSLLCTLSLHLREEKGRGAGLQTHAPQSQWRRALLPSPQRPRRTPAAARPQAPKMEPRIPRCGVRGTHSPLREVAGSLGRDRGTQLGCGHRKRSSPSLLTRGTVLPGCDCPPQPHLPSDESLCILYHFM